VTNRYIASIDQGTASSRCLLFDERGRIARGRALTARLTPREREVLQSLADGLSNKEIARRLHISVETQRTHMVNILAKLEAHSQLQALVVAVRFGIVDVR